MKFRGREIIVKKSPQKGCLIYVFPPIYDERDLEVIENEFGIAPVPLKDIEFEVNKLNQESELRRIKRELKQRRFFRGEKSIVYAIVNPLTNTPFYIGSTKEALSKRLWCHIRYGRYNPIKSEIIKEILSKKQKPLMVELCKCPTELQFREERRWILGASKTHKLSNIKCKCLNT